MGPPHEGSIRRPIAPWANRSTSELRPAPTDKDATQEQNRPFERFKQETTEGNLNARAKTRMYIDIIIISTGCILIEKGNQ